MCLWHVDSVKKGLSRKVFVGYKIFLRIQAAHLGRADELTKDLYYQFRRTNNNNNGIVQFNKWLIAVQKRIRGNNKYYLTGFHIYKNKVDAVGARFSSSDQVVEVKYTGILAEGTEESNRKVVVANRMYIPLINLQVVEHTKTKTKKERG